MRRPRLASAIAVVPVILLVIIGASVAGCGGSGGSGHERTLHIYASQPMHGGRGGLDMLRAIEVAVNQANQDLDGARVSVIGLNDARPSGTFDPALVRRNVRRAIADPKSIAYVGEFDSGATAIAMPMLDRHGILQVSTISTAVYLTHGGPNELHRLQPHKPRNFARVVPNDSVQSAAQTLLMGDESVKRVYVFDDRSSYGRGLAAGFERLAPDEGIKVIGHSAVGPTTPGRQLGRRIAKEAPDAIFFAGSNLRLARAVFDSVYRAAPQIKLFGGDGLALPGFLHSLGEIEANTYLTAPMLPPGNYATSGKAFLKTFKSRFGRRPAAMSVFGYEAGSALMNSLVRGTRGDIRSEPIADLRKGVRDAFFDINQRASALGSYSIDDRGDTTLASYGAYRVENGRLVLGRALLIPPSTLQEAMR